MGLPEVWSASCSEVGYTREMQVILDSKAAEVLVTVDGEERAIPNIARPLMLVVRADPGSGGGMDRLLLFVVRMVKKAG